MTDRDYSHRDVLDKLGVKPGQAVRFVPPIDEALAELQARVLERIGRGAADDAEPLDLVFALVDDRSDPVAILSAWRPRLKPRGAIWLLTWKRRRPGYRNQAELISAGLAAGLVDNKVCAVSEVISAMRFVIRRSDRA